MIVADERVARFVSEQLGLALCPPFTCLGIERDGEIVAGAVFNHFEGADVHVTIAGKGWTREFIEAVGGYVFGQLYCARMTAVTRDCAVAEYGKRLGGEIEGVLRDHFGPGRDATILGILRRDWKFGITPPLQRG